jgi:hypothetical protein
MNLDPFISILVPIAAANENKDGLSPFQKEQLGIAIEDDDYIRYTAEVLLPISNIRFTRSCPNGVTGCVIYLYEEFLDGKLEVYTVLTTAVLEYKIREAQRQYFFGEQQK